MILHLEKRIPPSRSHRQYHSCVFQFSWEFCWFIAGVREAMRRRWDDPSPSPSDSEESVDRSSTTTHGYTTHKPNDFWEL